MVSGSAGDLVTVLKHSTVVLTKMWLLDGSIQPYGDAKYFTPQQYPVTGLADLSDLLTELAGSAHHCVVRGLYKGDDEAILVDEEYQPGLVRRVKALFDDVPHHWVMLDVDVFDTLTDPVTEPEAACREFVLSALPEPFHHASFHWHLSSSAGHPDKPGLRAHLWFWLDQPATGAQLVAWIEREGLPVDPAVCRVVQVHYTGDPVMAPGVRDPVPCRSGLYRSPFGHDVYGLVLPEVEAPAPRERLTVPEGAGDSELSGMLAVLDPDLDYPEWVCIGQALHHETEGSDAGLVLWEDWSSMGAKYEPGVCEEKWATFGRQMGERPVGLGTLRKMARAAGWVEDLDSLFAEAPVEAEPAVSVRPARSPEPVNVDLPLMPRREGGLRYNSQMVVCSTREAVARALLLEDVVGFRLGYDEFTRNRVLSRDRGRTWEMFNIDDFLLTVSARLESGTFHQNLLFEQVPLEDLRAVVKRLCNDYRIDSARMWLESLRWDGVPRIKTFFHDHFALGEETPAAYAEALGSYMWTAMAGRIMVPGCQADIAPVLIGAKGMKKTSLVRCLVPDPGRQFLEIHLKDTDSDNTKRLIVGKLVAEMAEMKGLRSEGKLEEIKAFLTRREETWVAKFEEDSRTYPRRLLFIGTANEEAVITDHTGNRRLAPLVVGVDGKQIDTGMIERLRDQFWAEGLACWREHGIAWQAMEDFWDHVNERFDDTRDELETPIQAWLDQPCEGDFAGGENSALNGDIPFSMSRLMTAIGLPLAQQSRREQLRVGRVLRSLGYEKAVVWEGGERRAEQKGVKKWCKKVKYNF